jgi:hypothetical protein
MSLYLVTMLLAVAAAFVTAVDLSSTIEQPGSANAALMVRP